MNSVAVQMISKYELKTLEKNTFLFSLEKEQYVSVSLHTSFPGRVASLKPRTWSKNQPELEVVVSRTKGRNTNLYTDTFSTENGGAFVSQLVSLQQKLDFVVSVRRRVWIKLGFSALFLSSALRNQWKSLQTMWWCSSSHWLKRNHEFGKKYHFFIDLYVSVLWWNSFVIALRSQSWKFKFRNISDATSK